MPNSPMHYAFSASQEQFVRGEGEPESESESEWGSIGMLRGSGMEWDGMSPTDATLRAVQKTMSKLRRQRATKSIRDQSQKTQRNKGLSMRDERWRSFHVDFGLRVRVGWGGDANLHARARGSRSQLAATRSMCVCMPACEILTAMEELSGTRWPHRSRPNLFSGDDSKKI